MEGVRGRILKLDLIGSLLKIRLIILTRDCLLLNKLLLRKGDRSRVLRREVRMLRGIIRRAIRGGLRRRVGIRRRRRVIREVGSRLGKH